jgi:hypothetical protein
VHDPQHGNVAAQQANRDRRAAFTLEEFARAVLRIDEPAPAGERPGAEAGFFAEEIAGNERLQAFAQPLFDLYVDRCLAAAWAGARRDGGS